MSPTLIDEWKKMGIPFSKPEYYYSNIDTIIKRNQTTNIDLIGMGYVYCNPEYYQGSDAYDKLKQENDYLWEEAKKYQQTIKPFFAIDPLKDYAIDEIKRCLTKTNICGIKLHFNASQVYLTEPEHLKKVKPIFQLAAENNLPILLHFDNWHPKFGKTDVEILVDSILNKIPKLELRIAHFGTSGGFNQKTKNVINAFIELREKGRIAKRHKILFDISAVALDKDSEGVKKLTKKEFEELNSYIHKIGTENIIFGTDYPLYLTNKYIDVLKSKLKLSESEIKMILKLK
jgi:predicted TIM-barrel fold metal-dependent hydrolase